MWKFWIIDAVFAPYNKKILLALIWSRSCRHKWPFLIRYIEKRVNVSQFGDALCCVASMADIEVITRSLPCWYFLILWKGRLVPHGIVTIWIFCQIWPPKKTPKFLPTKKRKSSSLKRFWMCEFDLARKSIIWNGRATESKTQHLHQNISFKHPCSYVCIC